MVNIPIFRFRQVHLEKRPRQHPNEPLTRIRRKDFQKLEITFLHQILNMNHSNRHLIFNYK